MKNLVCILLISLIISCHGQEIPSAQNGKTNPDSLIKSVLAENNIPSIAIGIVQNGKTVFAKGYGYADVEAKRPANENTVYQIGSVTKLFTGHLLSKLLHQGSMSLSDSLANYFTARSVFPKSPTGQVVTIRDIATHSAEFPRYPVNLIRVDPEPIRGYSKSEMMEGIKQVSIDTTIGKRYRYSNFGYGVLGTAMANQMNIDLAVLLDNYIFSIYGMKNSSLFLTESQEKSLAVPYLQVLPYERTQPWNMESLAGAGNIFSTISDLNRFMIALLEANEVNDLQQTRHLKINETWSYGLGCFIIDSKKRQTQIIYHGGDIDGYASSLSVYPEYQFGIAILVNWGEGQIVGEAINLINSAVVDHYLCKTEE